LHKTTRFSVIYIHKKHGGCSSNNNRDIGSQRWSWVCIEKKRVTGSLLPYVCVCVCVCDMWLRQHGVIETLSQV